MKLGIVIPAYNEEKRIENTLESYLGFLDSASEKNNFEYKLLVVINNTQDRTEEIVKKYSEKNKNVIYLNFKRGGKGFAVIEGFKEFLNAKYDLIGFVDADMATSPEAFYDLIKNIRYFDGIIASRYVKGAKVTPKQSIQRIFVSRIFNFLTRSLFMMNYRDTQCGAKLFKREALNKIMNELKISQWAFDVDLVYNLDKKRLRIKEHPTIWSDRAYSKINFVKAGPRMALAIIRIRLVNSPIKFIVKAYDILPNWIKPSYMIK